MKCCSAPGKVLVTGGYLVLDRPNTGIVLTVNARFYTSIQALPASATEKHGKAKIIVISPQFNSKLEYIVQWEPTIKLEKMCVQPPSHFITYITEIRLKKKTNTLKEHC